MPPGSTPLTRRPLSGSQVLGHYDATLIEAHRPVLDVLVAGFLGLPEQVDMANVSADSPHQPQRVVSCLHDLIIVTVAIAPRGGHRAVSLYRDDARPGTVPF